MEQKNRLGSEPFRLLARITGHGAILALLGVPLAAAETITVAPEAVVVAADGVCALREAIDNANDTTTGQVHADCAAGAPAAADTIELAVGSSYLVPDGPFVVDGRNGLPPLTSAIVLNGNGATIARADLGCTRVQQYRLALRDAPCAIP